MQVLSPATERDLAARELANLARTTLDEHWAVAAVPAERRVYSKNALIRRARCPRSGQLEAWARCSPAAPHV